MSKYVCQHLPTTSVEPCIHALHGSYDRSWCNWGSDCVNEVPASIFCRMVVARSCPGSCVAVLISEPFRWCLTLAYWILRSYDWSHRLWIDVSQSSCFHEQMRCSNQRVQSKILSVRHAAHAAFRWTRVHWRPALALWYTCTRFGYGSLEVTGLSQ